MPLYSIGAEGLDLPLRSQFHYSQLATICHQLLPGTGFPHAGQKRKLSLIRISAARANVPLANDRFFALAKQRPHATFPANQQHHRDVCDIHESAALHERPDQRSHHRCSGGLPGPNIHRDRPHRPRRRWPLRQRRRRRPVVEDGGILLFHPTSSWRHFKFVPFHFIRIATAPSSLIMRLRKMQAGHPSLIQLSTFRPWRRRKPSHHHRQNYDPGDARSDD